MTRFAKQETYDQIFQGQLLEPRQLEAYHTLFHCGPMGKTSLNQMCAQMTGTSLTEEWSEQLPKMFGLGLLEWEGNIACPKTGVQEDVWDVSGNLPKERPAAPATQQPPEAAQQEPEAAKPLKDSKPPKKKLKEGVDYIAMAVKLQAADEGIEVPESVQHTLRWLRKSNTRTKKSTNGAASTQP